MRKLLALLAVGLATLFVAPVQAADMPEYPDIEIPDVDYGIDSSFYLRGSIAGNFMKAREFLYNCGCGPDVFDFEKLGYGYSFGAGIGYEFGDGLRADLTVDYLVNDGMYGPLQTLPDNITVGLRSTVALANVYYDFGLGSGDGFGSAAGGFGAYVGAGLGFAHYTVADIAPPPGNAPSGSGITGAGAVMAGVTYDMGTIVADLGYRGLYMPVITNSSMAQPGTLIIHDNFISELRGTVRYRFN